MDRSGRSLDGEVGEEVPVQERHRQGNHNFLYRKVGIICKNCRSLQSDERMQLLFEEVTSINWDVLILCETWRAERVETWCTELGHCVLGSGGTTRKHGVAIVLNHSLASSMVDFKAVSSRVAYADLRFNGRKLRVVSVHFPHQSYAVQHVQKLYQQLKDILENGKRKRYHQVIGGDFNASTGKRQHGENPYIIGEWGHGERNERGEMLVDWCSSNGLSIVNTQFKKHPVDACPRWQAAPN